MMKSPLLAFGSVLTARLDSVLLAFSSWLGIGGINTGCGRRSRNNDDPFHARSSSTRAARNCERSPCVSADTGPRREHQRNTTSSGINVRRNKPARGGDVIYKQLVARQPMCLFRVLEVVNRGISRWCDRHELCAAPD